MREEFVCTYENFIYQSLVSCEYAFHEYAMLFPLIECVLSFFGAHLNVIDTEYV